jgi:HNH endonuclease
MSDCVIWSKGKSPDGYGKVKVRGKTWRAHRYAYFLKNGPIPDGMWVLHKCDNPLCVNVDHLFLGTVRDNWDDCLSKGRYHAAKGEDSGQSKLTETQVLSIRETVGTCKEIGKTFGICPIQVSRIKRRERWGWL